MKNLNNYISERLHINKDTKVSIPNDVEEVLNTLELYDIAKGYLYPNFTLNTEDVKEIENIIQAFIDTNDFKASMAEYWTNRARKFKNPIIGRKYAKDSNELSRMSSKLQYDKSTEMIFQKDGFKVLINSNLKMICICGPFGGLKICEFV